MYIICANLPIICAMMSSNSAIIFLHEKKEWGGGVVVKRLEASKWLNYWFKQSKAHLISWPSSVSFLYFAFHWASWSFTYLRVHKLASLKKLLVNNNNAANYNFQLRHSLLQISGLSSLLNVYESLVKFQSLSLSRTYFCLDPGDGCIHVFLTVLQNLDDGFLCGCWLVKRWDEALQDWRRLDESCSVSTFSVVMEH